MLTYGDLKTMTDIFRYRIDDAIEKPFTFKRLIEIIQYNLKIKKRHMRGKVEK
jgi:hypothetical protein